MAQKQKLERKLGTTLVSRNGRRARSPVIGPSCQAAEALFLIVSADGLLCLIHFHA